MMNKSKTNVKKAKIDKDHVEELRDSYAKVAALRPDKVSSGGRMS